MKQRSLIIIFSMVLLILGIGAAPAYAAGYDRCSWGTVCLFTGSDGGGTWYSFTGVSGFCTNVTGAANDTANSFANMRSGTVATHVQFYDGVNCTGHALHASTEWYGDGPFASGLQTNFRNWDTRGPGRHNDTDRASSIFFNTG